MSRELDFSLPEEAEKLKPKQARQGGGGSLATVFSLLAFVGVAILLVQAFLLGGKAATGPVEAQGAEGADVALKLERRGLSLQAAQVWEEEVESTERTPREKANLLFKVAKLYQDAGQPEKAIEFFYRAEIVGEGELSQDVQFEINRGVQECFERLGLFAALEEELTDRTLVDGTPSPSSKEDEVLAEIGKRKITRRDLKRSMEQLVDLQLQSMGGSGLPAEQKMMFKQQLLGQLQDRNAQLQLLNEVINQELLYRLAKQKKIEEEKGVQDLIQETMRQVLSTRALERELGDRVQLTATDFETYFKANQDKYREEEKVEISVIQSDDAASAEQVRTELAGGADFAEIAKRFSADEVTRGNGGRVQAPLSRAQIQSRYGLDAATLDALFGAEAGTVLDRDAETPRGLFTLRVEAHHPERVPTFQEVEQRVRQELVGKKQQEATQALIGELREKEKVIIHQARIQSPPAPEETKPDTDTDPDPDDENE